MIGVSQKTAAFIKGRVADFFAESRLLDDTKMGNFSEYVGYSKPLIYMALNGISWADLREKWLIERLNTAIDEACQNARKPTDFNILEICTQLGISWNLFDNRVGNRWNELKEHLDEIICRNLNSDMERFLSQVKAIDELSQRNFVEFSNGSHDFVRKLFPKDYWAELRIKWKINRLRQVMLEMYQTSKTKHEFSRKAIINASGFQKYNFFPYAEWLFLRETLPNNEIILLSAIDRLTDENIPINEFNWLKIFETAGINYSGHYASRPHLTRAYKVAYGKLLQQQQRNSEYETVKRQLLVSKYKKKDANDNYEDCSKYEDPKFFGEYSIDLSSDTWNLAPVNGRVCERSLLREDIQTIVWDFLKEELRRGTRAPATISSYFTGFLHAAVCLCDEIPDVKQATLEKIQRVWLTYQGTHSQRRLLKVALRQIFLLLSQVKDDPNLDLEEIRRISSWLETSTKLSNTSQDNDFLSEHEVNIVIEHCLVDIQSGVEFAESNPNLLLISTHKNAIPNASPILYWAIALIILLILFSGLRGESARVLEVNDIVQIGENSFALRWQHNKKKEWQVGHLDALISNLIQNYISKTLEIRNHLCTEKIFFTGNHKGTWNLLVSSRNGLDKFFDDFVNRHELVRGEWPLPLYPRLLRRTYVTRGFYQGIPLEALKNQLGHSSFETLLRSYIKLNKHEHPSVVGPALDNFGRQALTLWKKPLLLEDLSPLERNSILKARVSRDQGVGLCHQDRCIMAIEGSPPPCSLCRWLVTGSEFLQGWEKEYTYRKQQIEEFKTQPGTEALVSQLKCLLTQFEENYLYVKQNSL